MKEHEKFNYMLYMIVETQKHEKPLKEEEYMCKGSLKKVEQVVEFTLLGNMKANLHHQAASAKVKL